MLMFAIFKKTLNVRNWLASQNNSTASLPDSVLQHWKPLIPTILVKKNDILLFSSLTHG